MAGGTLAGLWRSRWWVYMGESVVWICRLDLSSASVVCICRLDLSSASVVGGEREEEEEEKEEEKDVHLKSNNPTLKGGEKP